MAIITLTTDFGIKDHFVGAVKGAIYNELEDVRIVDISHNISPFHIYEAAYVIQNAYKSFPEGTIHIIGVDSELNPENIHIGVYLDKHYFICADNGIMSLLISEMNPEKMVEINIHDRFTTNFPVLDVFVKVAAHLARGGSLDVVGRSISEIKELKGLQPVVTKGNTQIIGNVLYVDNYGNVITNIKKKFFDSIAKGRKFRIAARNTYIDKIYTRYSDVINFSKTQEQRVDGGQKLAIWNSSEYLELAVYKSNPLSVGGASSLFGLSFRDSISINFLPDEEHKSYS